MFQVLRLYCFLSKFSNNQEEENHLSVNIEEIVENLSDDEDDDFLGEKIGN